MCQILLDCLGPLSDELTRGRNFGTGSETCEVKTFMKIFVIDSYNATKTYASGKAVHDFSGGTQFSNEREFGAATKDFTAARLVAVWNELPGVTPVRRFTNRTIALRRMWEVIRALAPSKNTKADLIISLLRRSVGATLKDIMAATGWQAHSVRGFLSVRPKKLGIQVESFKREGERVYRIR